MQEVPNEGNRRLLRSWTLNLNSQTVDTSAKTLTATPAYYVFHHFSQYADPGSTVVGTSGGNAIAFKSPDGSPLHWAVGTSPPPSAQHEGDHDDGSEQQSPSSEAIQSAQHAIDIPLKKHS
jgi:hypothetical protein